MSENKRRLFWYVYMYRQCHRFLYRLKMISVQSYGAVYT